MLWEAVRLALRAIRRNVLRSFLTVLGVVIGVAAVIAMVTVGQGSSAQVRADVESLGTNVLVLRPGKRMMGPSATRDVSPAFTLRDVDALRGLPVAAAVAPTASSSLTAVYGNANATTTVTGTDSQYFAVSVWPFVRGRSFTEAEERGGSAVCILGETVRQTLFGNTDPTGEQIRLRNVSCQVIGLLEAKGASSFGSDQDDIVMIPIRALHRRVVGNSDVASISIALAGGVSSERGIREIEALMRERRRIGADQEDNFSVTDMKQISSMLTGISNVLAGLLSSVAAVSLLVGGIGIMNIMLVSVTERTREIGIRLAVGAEARQVLTQFLVEAVVLSLIGGVIGIALGLGLAVVGARVMAIPFIPDPLVILLAFAFSALVGVVFGYFPARRAARLDPIEALRYQ
ncbi:multidrug ABC transporter substrate-binding protein [Rhodobacter veldkampii DSM 11550]|uniref:Multidrug ABC transporter substrate-binding protein n=1 Tax=Phaeovulum veldkampii DSM 11550 TaxID=1185920 RepID=A0A2T4JH37_9RHOB|nr:ABC transporter permease [Phaeovulum veldkampii]MBK5944977.1 multidrug ABC transporter substrate-binding protein [Phaeovulum veldkampii DSM 11550]PTE17216.1 multidrug ABC transporter substrate-binding protein [Phaeovulum veldkampii DSM 11550]TDQ52620.1 putative ABC transport system permease protein [Phaeovulum veldkampii DSM 11550]